VKQRPEGLSFLVLWLLYLFFLPPCADGDESARMPAWGEGKCEVIIFSDYFCRPCQMLEGELEPVLRALLTRGRIRLVFVDLPLYRLTPLYNRYFLSATSARSDYEAAFSVRRLLFDLAGRFACVKEAHLEREFRARKIPLARIDPRPAQAAMADLARQYNITSTPAGVIDCPGRPLRILRGGQEIMSALRPMWVQGD